VASSFVLTVAPTFDWRDVEDLYVVVDERPHVVDVFVGNLVGVSEAEYLTAEIDESTLGAVVATGNLAATIDENENLTAEVTEVPGLGMDLNWNPPGEVISLEQFRKAA
jgi:hypothetical protein